MPDDDLRDAANTLLELCKARKLTLATAESCTGGLVAATLSEIPGSSLVLDRGFVSVDNRLSGIRVRLDLIILLARNVLLLN